MLAIYLAALDSADNAEAFEAVYERYKRLVYHVPARSSTTRTLLRM